MLAANFSGVSSPSAYSLSIRDLNEFFHVNMQYLTKIHDLKVGDFKDASRIEHSILN